MAARDSTGDAAPKPPPLRQYEGAGHTVYLGSAEQLLALNIVRESDLPGRPTCPRRTIYRGERNGHVFTAYAIGRGRWRVIVRSLDEARALRAFPTKGCVICGKAVACSHEEPCARLATAKAIVKAQRVARSFLQLPAESRIGGSPKKFPEDRDLYGVPQPPEDDDEDDDDWPAT